MAVKGHLVIEEAEGTYTLRRAGPGREPLAPEEQQIATKLFGGGSEVRLTQAQHQRVGGALSLLKEHLSRSSDRIHFLLNRGQFIGGLVVSLGVLLTTLLLSSGESGGAGGFLTVWLLGWSVGVGVLAARVLQAWRAALSGAGRRMLALPGAVFMTLFSIPFLLGEIVGIGALFAAGGAHLGVLLLCLVGVNYLFSTLLRAPTPAGRAMLDRIEGFERFLSATEEDRINRLQGPQRTPELYERLLPFAIALDLERRWSEQFASGARARGNRIPVGRVLPNLVSRGPRRPWLEPGCVLQFGRQRAGRRDLLLVERSRIEIRRQRGRQRRIVRWRRRRRRRRGLVIAVRAIST